MKSKAKLWAADYFLRLDKMILELKNNPLVDKVVFVKYQGLSEHELETIQNDIQIRLNDVIEINDLEVENHTEFKLNDYITEFYKISNGLHFSWNSHAVLSAVPQSNTLANASIDDFIVPKDEHDSCEGWVSLLPLDGWINNGKYDIYGDPPDSSFGEALTKKGAYLGYLDYFNFYYDACIQLDGSPNPLLAFGDDYSASYSANPACDFVIYMEYILSTYGAVVNRSNGIKYKGENTFEVFQQLENRIAKNEYDGLSEVLKQNEYANIEYIIKNHFNNKGCEYASLENFKSKPKEIYAQIENLLEINIEDEFGD